MMEHAKALAIAQSYMREFMPACDRIEIAGSLRRGKPYVHDIELVAIPKPFSASDLFGQPMTNINALTAMIDIGFLDMRPGRDYRLIKSGPKYKQIELPEGINLDLFIVTPPAQWGVQFTIRTGPADFSQWCVTSRRKGGCMPLYAEQKNGCVYLNGIPKPMPEEIDYLDFLGLGWIDPADRKPAWGKPPVLQVADVPKNPAVMDL